MIAVSVLAVSCTASRPWGSDGAVCPQVRIVNSKSVLTRQPLFRLELSGVDSYCYVEENIHRAYLIAQPHFELKRLHSGDETRLDFAYYVETLQGPPEYLGKKSYFAHGLIAEDQLQTSFSPAPAKVRIPADSPDFVVELGIDLSALEYEYNRAQGAQLQFDGDFADGFVRAAEPVRKSEPAQASGCSRCRL